MNDLDFQFVDLENRSQVWEVLTVLTERRYMRVYFDDHVYVDFRMLKREIDQNRLVIELELRGNLSRECKYKLISDLLNHQFSYVTYYISRIDTHYRVPYRKIAIA